MVDGIIYKETIFTTITNAQLKCLFVCGLRSTGDAEIWTRILSKIELNPNITQQQIAVECQQLVNLKHDSQIVQQLVLATTPAINTIQKQQNPILSSSTHKKPPSGCWNCGDWHFTQKCPFKTHHCCKCKKQEYEEGFCTSLVHKITLK